VLHHEPPSRIDADEAVCIAAEQHAGFIERTVGCCLVQEETVESDEKDELFLCKLNRNTKELRESLLHGLPLQRCRAALESEGHSVKLFSGALIFVQPAHYRLALRALVDVELQPDHLILARSVEHLVQEAMLPWLQRPGSYCKIRQQLSLPSTSCQASAADSEPEESIEDADFELIVERTFLCAMPTISMPNICKSTTDGDPRRGRNPRAQATLMEIRSEP